MLELIYASCAAIVALPISAVAWGMFRGFTETLPDVHETNKEPDPKDFQ